MPTAANDTITTLTCNPHHAIGEHDLALHRHRVLSPAGTPAGSVIFTDNGIALSQPTLVNGVASYTLTSRQSGTRTIIATYVPTGSLTASSASCVLTVSGAHEQHHAFCLSPWPPARRSPVTLTAYVSADTAGSRQPRRFHDLLQRLDSHQSPQVPLATGAASFTTTTLPPGIDQITCTYSGNCHLRNQLLQRRSRHHHADPLPAITPHLQFQPRDSAHPHHLHRAGRSRLRRHHHLQRQRTEHHHHTQRRRHLRLPPPALSMPGNSTHQSATWFATPNALAAQASLSQVVTIPAAPPDFSLTGTDTTFPRSTTRAPAGAQLDLSWHLQWLVSRLPATHRIRRATPARCKPQTVNSSAGLQHHPSRTPFTPNLLGNKPRTASLSAHRPRVDPSPWRPFSLLCSQKTQAPLHRPAALLCLIVLTTLAAALPQPAAPTTSSPSLPGLPTHSPSPESAPARTPPTPVTHTITVNVTIAR